MLTNGPAGVKLDAGRGRTVRRRRYPAGIAHAGSEVRLRRVLIGAVAAAAAAALLATSAHAAAAGAAEQARGRGGQVSAELAFERFRIAEPSCLRAFRSPFRVDGRGRLTYQVDQRQRRVTRPWVAFWFGLGEGRAIGAGAGGARLRRAGGTRRDAR